MQFLSPAPQAPPRQPYLLFSVFPARHDKMPGSRLMRAQSGILRSPAIANTCSTRKPKAPGAPSDPVHGSPDMFLVISRKSSDRISLAASGRNIKAPPRGYLQILHMPRICLQVLVIAASRISAEILESPSPARNGHLSPSG